MGCQEAGFQGQPLGIPGASFLKWSKEDFPLWRKGECLPVQSWASAVGLVKAVLSTSLSLFLPSSKEHYLKKDEAGRCGERAQHTGFHPCPSQGLHAGGVSWVAILQSGHGGGPGDSEAETEAEQCKRVPEWMSILWLRPAGTRPPGSK